MGVAFTLDQWVLVFVLGLGKGEPDTGLSLRMERSVWGVTAANSHTALHHTPKNLQALGSGCVAAS